MTCFKTNPLYCNLLVRWDDEYKEPWFVVTDLAEDIAYILWLCLRPWIECSYRDIKSDGWQWHKNRLSCPERGERIWLAMAVATLFTLALCGDAAPTLYSADLPSVQMDGFSETKREHKQKKHKRHISCFLRGLLTILADLLNDLPLSLRPLFPESWPVSLELPIPNTSLYLLSRNKNWV